MKKITLILIIALLSINTFAQKAIRVKAKVSVGSDSLYIFNNGDSLLLVGGQDGQILQRVNGRWVNQVADIDTAQHSITSDTSTVALRTQSQTNIFRVDQTTGKGDYTTIQAAINAANDSSGIWQIQINEGLYEEQLTLYDSIQLVGVDDDMVVISSTSPVITFAAEKSAIRDVTIMGSGTNAALYANNTSSTSEIKIQNCDINTGCCAMDFTSDGTVIFQNSFLNSINTSATGLSNSYFKVRGDAFIIAVGNIVNFFDNRVSGDLILFDDSTSNRSIYANKFFDLRMTNASYSGDVTGLLLQGSGSVDIQNTIQNYDVSTGDMYFVNTSGGGNVHLDVSSSDLNFDVYSYIMGFTHSTGDTINVNLCSINKEIGQTGTGKFNLLINQDGTLVTNENIVDQNMSINPSTSTNKSLSDFFNITSSAGWVSGGAISIVTDSTVSITSGTGLIRISDNDQATLKMFDYTDTTNLKIPTINQEYYTYVDYNSGDPEIKITTNTSLITGNENNRFELHAIVRESDTIHVIDHYQKAINTAKLIQQWVYQRKEIERSEAIGGLVIGDGGNRTVTLSAGQLSLKFNYFPISSMDTGTGDLLDLYYRDGSGGFTKIADQTTWDSLRYDDGSGTLATFINGRYGYFDYWIETDGSLVGMYGQGQYTSEALAKAAPLPSNTPSRIESQGLYVGRNTLSEGTGTTTFYSAFTDAIGGSATITNHNSLSGIDGDGTQHISATQLAYMQDWADSVASVLAVELNTEHRLADNDTSQTNEVNDSVRWDNSENIITVYDNGGGVSDTITGFLEENDLSGIRDTLVVHDDSISSYDVRISNLENTGTGVTSFNGRSGAVVPRSNDYITDSVSEGNVNLYFTDERAQDAVGDNFASSGSVEAFYDDGIPSFSWAVIPGGVDHDQLLNYVSGEHLDTTVLATDYELDTSYTSLRSDIVEIENGYIKSDNHFTTNNAVVVVDGTGRVIKETGVEIDSSDNITANNGLFVNLLANSGSFPVGRFNRTTTLTSGNFNNITGVSSAILINTKTSGIMTEGFGGGLVFGANDVAVTGNNFITRLYSRIDESTNEGCFQIFTRGINALVPTVTFRSSGRVGFLTTTPSSELEVDGEIKATSYSTPTGTSTTIATMDGGFTDLEDIYEDVLVPYEYASKAVDLNTQTVTHGNGTQSNHSATIEQLDTMRTSIVSELSDTSIYWIFDDYEVTSTEQDITYTNEFESENYSLIIQPYYYDTIGGDVYKVETSYYNLIKTTTGFTCDVSSVTTNLYYEAKDTIPLRSGSTASTESISYDHRSIVWGQGISISIPGIDYGDTYSSSLIGCTSYSYCNNALSIELTMPVLTTTPTQGLVFYDQQKNAIVDEYALRPQGTSNGIDTVIITDIPLNAHYFRTSFWNYDNAQTYGDYYCKVELPKGTLGNGKFLPFQNGQIHYSCEVNLVADNFIDSVNVAQDSAIYADPTGVLILPDSYTSNGTKTKAIMFCSGLSRNVTFDEWGLNYQPFLDQKERYRDAGFAVFDVNGQKNNSGSAIPTIGSPQAISACKQAQEYICKYYNISDEILVVGASAGGVLALNYCYTYGNVRALALLSPWTDLENCAWGQNIKSEFPELYGFDGTTTYEADKTQGYEPYKRIITVGTTDMIPYFKVPVKMWMGGNEYLTVLYDYAIEFMEALRQGGNIAKTRILKGVGHETTNGGSIVTDEETIEFLKRF